MKKPAKYDKIAEEYFKYRYNKLKFSYNTHIEVPALIKLVGNVKNKTLLDMGCGFGDHAKKLSKKGFKKLIGFDISPKIIELAKSQNIKNSEFYVGNMSKKLKHKNNSFDLVISSLAIHYIKNINKLFADVNRVLKKGGIFVFSTGHPIYNLLNQSKKGIISARKDEGKLISKGKYFDESAKPNYLGGLGWLKLYSRTFETLIKTALKNNFEIIDYVDAKPIPSSKKLNKDKYKLTSSLPTFILFKLRKK